MRDWRQTSIGVKKLASWLGVGVAFMEPVLGMLCLRHSVLAGFYLLLEVSVYFLLLIFVPTQVGAVPFLALLFLPIRLVGTFHAYLIVSRVRCCRF